MSGPRTGLVAVLFTDLVGSTELMSQLGDRAFDELRRQHFAALGKAVAAHGGQEVKNTGDGLMAVFPSAAEAVEAAVAMQQATARQSRTHPVSVRVGVAVGDATVEGGDYFGTPVVEAARLVAGARPGQVLTTQITRALAGSRCTASFIDHGPRELKGLPGPVAVSEVAWKPAGSSVPMPALLTDMGRIFVGRDAELERLGQLWKEATVGERCVALVAGEPGVGKTRLAAELAMRVHEEGATVLAGRCDEDLGMPYQPLVEALRQFVDHTPPADLLEGLGRYGGELVRLMPDVAERLPELPAPLQSDPETERYRLFDAVAAWMVAASTDQPVLVVLDDLQWAAKPTLLLLRHLVRASAAKAAFMVLGTYRDTELKAEHPLVELLADLRRDGRVERLSLSGLDLAAVGVLVQHVTGRPSDAESVTARVIHSETQGNPFFLREVLRHLGETGALDRDTEVTDATIDDLGIPESVRDVIGRRLSRLSEETHQALQQAAILGLEFDIRLVQESAGLEEDALITSLGEAFTAHLVHETYPGTYRFVHALVRSAVYQSLSPLRRAQLHLRAADVLERRRAGDASRLAHHLLAAVPLAPAQRSAAACLAAGDQALGVLANTQAADWYRRGLAVLDDGDDPTLSIDLRIGLGESHRRIADPAFREVLLEASRRAVALNDTARLVRAVLANHRGFTSVIGHVDQERIDLITTALHRVDAASIGDRAELLALLSSELLFGFDHLGRLDTVDEATVLAAQTNDPAVQTKVGMSRLLAGLVPDRVMRLVREGSDVVRLADAAADPHLKALALALWVGAQHMAGRLDEARCSSTEALAIAEETGHPGLAAFAQMFHAAALDALGDHAEAAALTESGTQLAQEAGFPDALMWYAGRMALHWAWEGQPHLAAQVAAQGLAEYPRMVGWYGTQMLGLALAGHTEEFAERCGRLNEILDTIPVDLFWLVSHFTMAVAMGFDGYDATAASRLYERLLPHRELHAAYLIGYAGPIEVPLGALARVLGKADTAVAHHEAAAATIQAVGAARARALNDYLYARALLARGQPGDIEQATQLLLDMSAYARQKGYTTFEQHAEQSLTGLAGHGPA